MTFSVHCLAYRHSQNKGIIKRVQKQRDCLISSAGVPENI